MDLPLSGSSETLLVDIETPLFNFYIKNVQKKDKINKISEEDQASYQMTCKEVCRVNLLNLGNWETNQFEQLAMPQFFEQTPYEIVIENKSGKSLKFDHDSRLIRSKVTPIGRRGLILSGVINFENEIGMTELRVLVEGRVYFTLTIEIYPTKLSYKADYLQLREDIATEIYNLAFDFMKKTYMPAALVYKEKPSLTEFFSILRGQFNQLIQSIELIIRNPHHKLEQYEEVRRYREGQKITNTGICYLNQHPGQLLRTGNRVIPQKLRVTHKQITMDTYENQIVKHMIFQLIARLQRILNYGYVRHLCCYCLNFSISGII